MQRIVDGLCEAVRNSDRKRIKCLFAESADVNSREGGITPLIFASQRGKLQIVKFLVENKASLNLKTTFMIDKKRDFSGSLSLQPQKSLVENYTALIAALASRQTHVVRYLIDQGADVNIPSDRGNSPIVWGTYDVKVLKWLVEEGKADVRTRDDSGTSVFLHAVHGGKIRKFAGPPDKIDRTALYGDREASIDSSIQSMTYLVSEKVDPDARDANGRTAVDYAIERDSKAKLLRFLVEEAHVDVNVAIDQNFVLNHYTMELDNLRYLVEHVGIDPRKMFVQKRKSCHIIFPCIRYALENIAEEVLERDCSQLNMLHSEILHASRPTWESVVANEECSDMLRAPFNFENEERISPRRGNPRQSKKRGFLQRLLVSVREDAKRGMSPPNATGK
mmetsp:Transcript_14091/g.21372  ORF Transcript_14091/g.21372 Transcript_14091/m.21372 type:complete len:392 (-) Transcript_14091:190-1365(-)